MQFSVEGYNHSKGRIYGIAIFLRIDQLCYRFIRTIACYTQRQSTNYINYCSKRYSNSKTIIVRGVSGIDNKISLPIQQREWWPRFRNTPTRNWSCKTVAFYLVLHLSHCKFRQTSNQFTQLAHTISWAWP